MAYRILALPLLASFSASVALGQYSQSWSRQGQLPGQVTSIQYGVYALDDGGALTVAGEAALPDFPDTLVLTRYGGDGAELWSTSEPFMPFLPFPGFGPAIPAIDVRGDGACAVATVSGPEVQLMAFDASGGLLWRKDLAATRASYELGSGTPFLDVNGDVALSTVESRAFFDPATDTALTALERFGPSGASLFRVEHQARIGERLVPTPSGETFLISQDQLFQASFFRYVERYDRAGQLVSAGSSVGGAVLWRAAYDPRTDGTLLVTRLHSFPSEVEARDATGALLSSAQLGIDEYGGAGCVIDGASGVAFLGGRDGARGAIAGFDLAGNQVVSGSYPGSLLSTVLGLRASGGLAVLESRSTTINCALVSSQGVRDSSTAIRSVSSELELSLAFDVGSDGRLWQAEARSAPFGSMEPATRGVDQWIAGIAGSIACFSSLNSTGAAGHLSALGSDVALENRITLAASFLPPHQFGLFITGGAPDFIPGVGGGAGTLCIAAGIGRFNGPGQVRATLPSGQLALEIDLTQIPTPSGFTAASAGQSHYFQLWHRDIIGAGGSNLTNSVVVTLQ